MFMVIQFISLRRQWQYDQPCLSGREECLLHLRQQRSHDECCGLVGARHNPDLRFGRTVDQHHAPNGTERIISYDAAGQSTNIIEMTAANLPIALFRFNWNSAAEVQWEFAAPLPHAVTVPTRTMTYDNDNRLSSVDGNNVTEDLDGNLVSGPLTNDTFAVILSTQEIGCRMWAA